MKRFFRALFLFLEIYPWEDRSPWTDEDTLRLKQFLLSDVGVRLRTKLRNTSILINANSVQSGSEKACGQATGYMLCLADLQSLSGSGAPQQTADETSESDGDLTGIEHMSP
jgi:hypothetical protein